MQFKFDANQEYYVKASSIRALALGKNDLFICRDKAMTDELVANLALQCRLKTI